MLGILEGLSEEDLRRPVLPSGWACVGLVQHLALDVERWWFRTITAGEPDESAEVVSDSWQVSPHVPADAVLDLYRREIERANAIIARAPLDTPPATWPEDIWPTWHLENLRQTLLHVITEMATHAGHLDAARELIDGRTWLVVN